MASRCSSVRAGPGRPCAGADGDDGVAGQRVEVGGDVAGGLHTAVHAADAAGGEHLDAGRVGQRDRGRHRGHALGPALGDGHGDVALGDLGAAGQHPSTSSGARPTRGRPSSTAVTAGTAPAPRTAASRGRRPPGCPGPAGRGWRRWWTPWPRRGCPRPGRWRPRRRRRDRCGRRCWSCGVSQRGRVEDRARLLQDAGGERVAGPDGGVHGDARGEGGEEAGGERVAGPGGVADGRDGVDGDPGGAASGAVTVVGAAPALTTVVRLPGTGPSASDSSPLAMSTSGSSGRSPPAGRRRPAG